MRIFPKSEFTDVGWGPTLHTYLKQWAAIAMTIREGLERFFSLLQVYSIISSPTSDSIGSCRWSIWGRKNLSVEDDQTEERTCLIFHDQGFFPFQTSLGPLSSLGLCRIHFETHCTHPLSSRKGWWWRRQVPFKIHSRKSVNSIVCLGKMLFSEVIQTLALGSLI